MIDSIAQDMIEWLNIGIIKKTDSDTPSVFPPINPLKSDGKEKEPLEIFMETLSRCSPKKIWSVRQVLSLIILTLDDALVDIAKAYHKHQSQLAAAAATATATASNYGLNGFTNSICI
jgi:hypothetical protein